MGYTTDFGGSFVLDKPLTPEHKAYLNQFCNTARLERDPAKLKDIPDPIREAVGLPVGKHGEFFVKGEGYRGQDHTDDSVLGDYNKNLPGKWCQWVPNGDGTEIEWDGGEKFYKYVEWIEYLIKTFLDPWGYKLNGEVKYAGEDPEDVGTIIVSDNHVETYNYIERNIKTEEAINEILKRIPDQLPLLMGINDLLDSKLKKIFKGDTHK